MMEKILDARHTVDIAPLGLFWFELQILTFLNTRYSAQRKWDKGSVYFHEGTLSLLPEKSSGWYAEKTRCYVSAVGRREISPAVHQKMSALVRGTALMTWSHPFSVQSALFLIALSLKGFSAFLFTYWVYSDHHLWPNHFSHTANITLVSTLVFLPVDLLLCFNIAHIPC